MIEQFPHGPKHERSTGRIVRGPAVLAKGPHARQQAVASCRCHELDGLMIECSMPHGLKVRPPGGPDWVLGVASSRDEGATARREHARDLAYESIQIGEQEQHLVGDDEIDGAIGDPRPFVRMQEHYRSRERMEAETGATAGLLERFDTNDFSRLPSLGDPSQQPTPVTSNIQDSMRSAQEPIATDVIDHRGPEHLVTSLEAIFVGLILKESGTHCHRRPAQLGATLRTTASSLGIPCRGIDAEVADEEIDRISKCTLKVCSICRPAHPEVGIMMQHSAK